jgi:hypothetical protein
MNRWQTVKPEQKYTAKQFDRDLPDEDACLEYVKEQVAALCARSKNSLRVGSGTFLSFFIAVLRSRKRLWLYHPMLARVLSNRQEQRHTHDSMDNRLQER